MPASAFKRLQGEKLSEEKRAKIETATLSKEEERLHFTVLKLIL